jgi:hypothetical protein
MRRLTVFSIAMVAMLLGLGTFAIAQTETFLDGKVRTGDRITIGGDEVIDGDLYVFAGDISVSGRITGDLIVFGGQVNITGEVEGDVTVGAGVVDISGEVGGDLRAGAGQLRVDGVIAEDVFAGVGRLDAGGTIGGDLVFGAGQVLVPGVVGGDVLGSTGSYDRSGSVAGTEDVTLEQAADVERPGPVTRALRQFGSLLVLGLGVIWIGRKRFEQSMAAIDTNVGSVIVRGLVFLAALVLVPLGVTIAGALLAILFAWIGLGLLVGVTILTVVLTWFVVVTSAILMIAVFAPIAAATWVASRLLPADTPVYGLLAAGLAGIVILLAIPMIGPLVGLAVTILGAGAWLSTIRWRRSPSEPAALEAGDPVGGSGA